MKLYDQFIVAFGLFMRHTEEYYHGIILPHVLLALLTTVREKENLHTLQVILSVWTNEKWMNVLLFKRQLVTEQLLNSNNNSSTTCPITATELKEV